MGQMLERGCLYITRAYKGFLVLRSEKGSFIDTAWQSVPRQGEAAKVPRGGHRAQEEADVFLLQV